MTETTSSGGTPDPELPHVDSDLTARLTNTFGPDVDPAVQLGEDSSRQRVSELASRGSGSRYRLDGEIARGGMGAILKIRDNDLRRTLAMKVMLEREGSDKTAGLSRFLEEAQVTGQLDHPGVVPVHELGVDHSGRVYFTMRLVRGQDLKEVIDLHHRGDADWTLPRCVEVILRACEALAYAHDKGVVHRDLKPANIMAGKYGEVYVMDWGLARVLGRSDSRDLRIPESHRVSLSDISTDRNALREQDADSPIVTRDGTIVGTPAYMPPEQARGDLDDVDQRADVYSMGAVLYELLAGTAPYVVPGDRMGPWILLARVVDGPPRPLGDLAPDVQPELEAICAKAMARGPDQRYSDVGELAEDLRSFLEGRVVRAYRTGAVIELRKWIERNRGVAASLLGVLVVVITSAIGITSVHAAGRQRTETERMRAAEAEEDARVSAARLDRVQGHLENFLESTGPMKEGRAQLVADLLELAVEEFGMLEADALFELVYELGETQFALGDFNEAHEHFEQSVWFAELGHGRRSIEAAKALRSLGSAHQKLGRRIEAEKCVRESTSILREKGDEEELIAAVAQLAVILKNQGRYEEARPIYEEAIELAEQWDEDSPLAFTAMNNLGLFYSSLREHETALEWLSRALDGRRRLLGEDHVDTCNSLDNVGNVLLSLGRVEEAETYIRAALQGRLAQLGADHTDTAISQNSLGRLLVQDDRFAEAETLYGLALETARTRYGATHPETLTLCENLAGVRSRLGRFEEAEALLLESLAVRRAKAGNHEPAGLVSALDAYADMLELQRDWSSAVEIRREELDEALAVFGDSRTTAQAAQKLSRALVYAERIVEAREALDRALEIYAALGEAGQERGLWARQHFANWCGDVDELPMAIETAQASLVLIRETGSPEDVAKILSDLGLYLKWSGRNEEAYEYYDESLAIMRSQPESPGLYFILNNMAYLLESMGRFDEAEPLFVEAIAGREQMYGADAYDTLTTVKGFAQLLRQDGRGEEAWGHLERVLEGSAERGEDRFEDLYQESCYEAGTYFLMERDPATAVGYLRDSLRTCRRLFGSASVKALEAQSRMAVALLELGEPNAASMHLEEVLDTLVERTPHDSVTLTVARMHLGRCMSIMDRAEEAEEHLLAAYERSEGLHRPEVRTRAVESLVEHYARVGAEEEAARFQQLLDASDDR